jgi:hypothetical protein
MAVATERWQGRTLTQDATSYTSWTAEISWDVIEADNETDALSAAGIPALRDPHPQNPLLKCRSRTPREDGFNKFIITCTYGIEQESWTAPDADPLAQPPRVRWNTCTSSEDVDRDIDGNPIVNSVGDAFSSPAKRRFNTKSFTIFRNEPFYNFAASLIYENTINSVAWTVLGVTFPAGTIMCACIEPTNEYDANAASYVTMAYTFEVAGLTRDYNPTSASLFQLRLLDQGQRAKYTHASVTTIGELYTAKGSQISSDVRFDPNGKPVDTTLKVERKHTPINCAAPAGATRETGPDGVTSYLRYKLYKPVAFSGIGLPS